MSASISIQGGPAYMVLSVRLTTLWRGPWVAELDVDPGPSAATTVSTSGSAVLTIGSSTLTGTIDPNFSGRFVSGALLRLVAGAGGWDKPVAVQDFTNDGGVQSSTVEQQTAALVGESVVDSAPIVLGTKWTRASGPASRVFQNPDRDWYVDAAGTTQVASRPAATPDKSLEILSYDAAAGRVEVACDALVLPGTTLTDVRFDGTLTVRAVEQTFSRDGSRATCWCSNVAVDPVMGALTNLVRELAGVANLRVIPYRYVNASSNGRVNLQAVDKAEGQPDLENVEPFAGMPGDTAKFAPATNVLVLFVEGQKGKPKAFAYDATLPLERTIDASTAVHVGPSATSVDLAGGEGGALVLADPYQELIVALTALATTLSGMTTAPLTPIGAAGTTFLTALQALPPPATEKVTAT